MPTPIGITITSTQGDFHLEVSMSAEASIGHARVAETQLERASKAMGVLLRTPWNDDEDED